MKMITAIILLAWIPVIYFYLDKKFSAWIEKTFHPKKTYDDNDPHYWGVGPFGSYSPVIAIIIGLIVVPAYFVVNYGDQFGLEYMIGFAAVSLIAIVIGTLERVYYR